MNKPEEHYEHFRSVINAALQTCVKDRSVLGDAMRYSLLAGGKRVRPVLVLEFCRVCGGKPDHALAFACAVECVHTYSLIHDDLPCMDDDALRRGKPTSHMVYGEAMALLAGDALLNLAFELCMQPCGDRTERAMRAGYELAAASGAEGMIGGQVLDIQNSGCVTQLEHLVQINTLKTGALLRAAARMGCIMGEATKEQLNAANTYADSIGKAFQIRDDLLDMQGDSRKTGKNAGSDSRKNKVTYASVLGAEACGEEIRRLTAEAEAACSAFSDNGFLLYFARYLADRQI